MNPLRNRLTREDLAEVRILNLREDLTVEQYEREFDRIEQRANARPWPTKEAMARRDRELRRLMASGLPDAELHAELDRIEAHYFGEDAKHYKSGEPVA